MTELVDATMDGVVGVNRALEVVLFNRAAERLFGLSEAAALGQPLTRFLRTEKGADKGATQDELMRVLTQKTDEAPQRLPGLHGVHVDGRSFPVEVSLSRLGSNEGLDFAVIVRDLSEELRAKDAAKDATSLFEAAFTSSATPMVIGTLDGAFVAANEAFGRLIGLSTDRIVGKTPSELWPKSQDALRFVEAMRQGGQGTGLECELTTLGGPRRVLLSFERVELGLVPHVFGVVVDLTERKKTTELLSTAFRSSPAGMSISTVAGELLEVNETLARSLGYTREELLGHNVISLGIWGDPAARQALVARIMRDGEALGFEATLKKKNGQPVRMLSSWVLLKVSDVPHIFAVTQDLSRQQEHEARLSASERRQAFTFNASPAAMLLIRVGDGVLVELNDASCRLFEVSRAQAIGKTAVELGFYSAQRQSETHDLLKRTGRVLGYETRVATFSGRPLDVLFSGEILELDGVPHLLASLIDITARKRAEAAAKESERRFLQVAENMREVFWLADVETAQALYVSPAYEQITGRKREELYANTSRLLAVVHPEDRERIGAALRTRPDGRSELDFRIVRPDGSTRFLHNEAFLVLDELGNAVRVAGIAEDVTEQQNLADQVRLAQKMESIGQLAGGVAHDFNNLLTVISSSSQYLRAQLGRSDGLFRALSDEIDSAVNRGTALTKQLLAFSRQQISSPIVLDLNDVVVETTKMLDRLLGANVRVVTSLLPGLPEVRADVGQLSQMLLNLAVNARDAMPHGGTLTIATADVSVDERFARSHLGLKPGRYTELSITDTGHGMTREVQAHLFEPFFTTKPAGKGTGLGLAVVFGIVQQSGGHILVDSEPGRGTSFRIFLQACTQAEKLEDAASAAEPVEGRETLLLVEDEDNVRWVASRGLRARGYVVYEAASGAEAMRLLEEHREEIALIVTDVVMPGMDGRELSILANRLCPTIPVLFTSGFTDDTVTRHGIRHDQVPFIEKPYSPNALARKVRQVLDARRPVDQPEVRPEKAPQASG